MEEAQKVEFALLGPTVIAEKITGRTPSASEESQILGCRKDFPVSLGLSQYTCGKGWLNVE